MNRLSSLPRGFGSFQCLETLDLTYNNLSEKTLPGNFCTLGKVYLLEEAHSYCYTLGWVYFLVFDDWKGDVARQALDIQIPAVNVIVVVGIISDLNSCYVV